MALRRGAAVTGMTTVSLLLAGLVSPGVETSAVFLALVPAAAVGKTVIVIGGAAAPGLKGSAASA